MAKAPYCPPREGGGAFVYIIFFCAHEIMCQSNRENQQPRVLRLMFFQLPTPLCLLAGEDFKLAFTFGGGMNCIDPFH